MLLTALSKSLQALSRELMLMLLRFCASLVTPFQALWTADTSDWKSSLVAEESRLVSDCMDELRLSRLLQNFVSATACDWPSRPMTTATTTPAPTSVKIRSQVPQTQRSSPKM